MVKPKCIKWIGDKCIEWKYDMDKGVVIDVSRCPVELVKEVRETVDTMAGKGLVIQHNKLSNIKDQIKK